MVYIIYMYFHNTTSYADYVELDCCQQGINLELKN